MCIFNRILKLLKEENFIVLTAYVDWVTLHIETFDGVYVDFTDNDINEDFIAFKKYEYKN